MRPRSRACWSPPRRWSPRCRRTGPRCRPAAACRVAAWAGWTFSPSAHGSRMIEVGRGRLRLAGWISDRRPENKKKPGRGFGRVLFFHLASIRRRAKTQRRRRAAQGHSLAAQAPVGDLTERRDHLLVGLRALRRAGLLAHRTDQDRDAVARDKGFTLPAPAPQIDLRPACAVDRQYRHALAAAHRPRVED